MSDSVAFEHENPASEQTFDQLVSPFLHEVAVLAMEQKTAHRWPTHSLIKRPERDSWKWEVEAVETRIGNTRRLVELEEEIGWDKSHATPAWKAC